MTEPLSAETIATMKSEHYEFGGICVECSVQADKACSFPCSTALLLAELDRREANPPRCDHRQPVPHLVEVQR